MKLTCVTAVRNAIESGNRENLIRCVESVAALKTPHEHLIYDGGSADGTVELLRELEGCGKMPHLRVASERDTGIYSALNKGVRDAKGEWFYVLGADDCICHPEVMDRILADAAREDVLVTEVYRGWEAEETVRGIWSDKIFWGTPYCHQGVLMKTQAVRDFGGFDERYEIDADYKLMLQCHLGRTVVRQCAGRDFRFATFGLGGSSSVRRDRLMAEHNRLLAELFGLEPEKVGECRRRRYLPLGAFLRYLFSPDRALRESSREMLKAWYVRRLRLWVLPLVVATRPIRRLLGREASSVGADGAGRAVRPRTGLISVVIPVYNVEEYLAECLDSLRRQTYADWEAICVDDGSTDGSLAILRRYAAMDSRFRICIEENCGQSVARNRGRGLASGEYCHFLDADDMLRADAFEKCVSVMKAQNLDHLVFGMEMAVDPRVADKVDVRGYRDYYTVDESLFNRVTSGKRLFADLVARHSFYVSPPLRLSRTDSLPPGDLFPANEYNPPHEDNYSTPRLLLAAERAMVIPDRLYIRRFRPQSSVTSEDPQRTHTDAFLSVYRLLGPLCRQERDPSVARQLRAYRRFIYRNSCSCRPAPPSLLQRVADACRLEPDVGSLFRRLLGFARRKLISSCARYWR